MIPQTTEELDRTVIECKKMVHKRALLSAGAAAVPIPGVDVAADMGLLLQLLPDINRKFGIAPSQIDEYDAQTKMMMFNLISRMGTDLAGRSITKRVVIQVLKKMGVRVTAKQAARYVPIIGSMISGGLSFTVMKMICNRHIRECHGLIEVTLDRPPQIPFSNRNEFQMELASASSSTPAGGSPRSRNSRMERE